MTHLEFKSILEEERPIRFSRYEKCDTKRIYPKTLAQVFRRAEHSETVFVDTGDLDCEAGAYRSIFALWSLYSYHTKKDITSFLKELAKLFRSLKLNAWYCPDVDKLVFDLFPYKCMSIGEIENILSVEITNRHSLNLSNIKGFEAEVL